MPKNKKLSNMLLAAVLAGSLTLSQAAAFTDTNGHWAQDAVSKWSEEYSIIRGYEDGSFRPDASITRGAFAVIMDRFMKYQKMSPASTFSDTPGTWCEESILRLNAAKVMLGDQGKALLWADISRQEAVVMLARAFGVPESGKAPAFSDADKISNFARGYVAAMAERGYLKERNSREFRPKVPITRAEVVNILDNMIEVLIQKPVVYDKDVDGTLMINSTTGAVLVDMEVDGDVIIAPGVSASVTLTDVDVKGSIRNLSSVKPTIVKTGDPQPVEPKPDKPARPDNGSIRPEDIYTPSATTGEYIRYSSQKIPVYAGVEPRQVGQGDFRWNGDRLEYVGGRYQTRFGIDVSAYQNRATEGRKLDWEAIRDDGVDFAMVRAGLRGTSSGTLHADAFYKENIRGAMAAGIDTGVYFFAQAITVEEAIEEADFVIGLLDGLKISGPVAYDWEMHDSSYRVYGTSPEMATACALAFCRRIEEAGYQAMVYAGQYVSYVKYDQGALKDYPFWYPEYKSASSERLYPTFYYQMDYWQYSSKARINGIGGNVDVSIQFLR